MKKAVPILLALLVLTSFAACKVLVAPVESPEPSPEIVSPSPAPTPTPSPSPSPVEETPAPVSEEPAPPSPTTSEIAPAGMQTFDTAIGFTVFCPTDYQCMTEGGMAMCGRNLSSDTEVCAAIFMKSPLFLEDLSILKASDFGNYMGSGDGEMEVVGDIRKVSVAGMSGVALDAKMKTDGIDVVVEYVFFNKDSETIMAMGMVSGTDFSKLDEFRSIVETVQKN